MSKKIASIGRQCVACGACTKVCPFGALSIDRGLRAVVDCKKCVGCGKCAKTCPADEVRICLREEVAV